MKELLTILTPIALIDSLSMVPMAIVPLAFLFSSRKPAASSAAFISGIFLPYLAAGVLATVGLVSVFDQLNEAVLAKLRHPNTLDLGLQIAIGLVLLTVGYRMASAREKNEDRKPNEPVTPLHAFTFAVGLVFVGLPGALPYFAAVDQVLRANLSTVPSFLALVWYNAVFVLPLVVLAILRLVFPTRAERIFGVVGRVADTWGRRIIIVLLILLGVVLVADGIGWFAGRPLLPVP